MRYVNEWYKETTYWLIIDLIILGVLFWASFIIIPFITATNVTKNIIDETKEKAYQNRVYNFANELYMAYLLSITSNSEVNWLDYDTNQIIFENINDEKILESALELTCKYGRIDNDNQVILKGCKFDNYKRVYNYENRKVIPNTD